MVVWLLVRLSIFLVLQPWSIVTAGDVLPPIISPIFEDVCNDMTCGRGICKPSNNSIIPYECECSPGWKQLATSDDDHHLEFLPCVIPNCTLNYSCSEPPSSAQEKENRGNESIFDVCRWTDCGAGKCEATSVFTHKCECNEGYHNLLNLTFSPCFKECSLGMDCKNIDFGFTNSSFSPPPPPTSSADRPNQDSIPDFNNQTAGQIPSANFRVEGSLNWLIFTLSLLAI